MQMIKAGELEGCPLQTHYLDLERFNDPGIDSAGATAVIEFLGYLFENTSSANLNVIVQNLLRNRIDLAFDLVQIITDSDNPYLLKSIYQLTSVIAYHFPILLTSPLSREPSTTPLAKIIPVFIKHHIPGFLLKQRFLFLVLSFFILLNLMLERDIVPTPKVDLSKQARFLPQYCKASSGALQCMRSVLLNPQLTKDPSKYASAILHGALIPLLFVQHRPPFPKVHLPPAAKPPAVHDDFTRGEFYDDEEGTPTADWCFEAASCLCALANYGDRYLSQVIASLKDITICPSLAYLPKRDYSLISRFLTILHVQLEEDEDGVFDRFALEGLCKLIKAGGTLFIATPQLLKLTTQTLLSISKINSPDSFGPVPISPQMPETLRPTASTLHQVVTNIKTFAIQKQLWEPMLPTLSVDARYLLVTVYKL